MTRDECALIVRVARDLRSRKEAVAEANRLAMGAEVHGALTASAATDLRYDLLREALAPRGTPALPPPAKLRPRPAVAARRPRAKAVAAAPAPRPQPYAFHLLEHHELAHIEQFHRQVRDRAVFGR